MEKLKEKNLFKRGIAEAKKITRQFAKTFYFGSLFLPADKKQAAYCIYAVCRISDEAIDNPSSVPFTLSKIKENIEAVYKNAPPNNLLLAFKKIVEKYNIPKDYFDELLSGMQMDTTKNRYKNFKDLYKYCYKAAGVVGLMMLKILGAKNQEAEKYAINLGIAMQLTNILRDIKEDFSRGRIYLPLDEMRKLGLTQTIIKKEEINENFKNFLKFQIMRARDYYEKSMPGIKMIKGLRNRFVILCIKEIYAGILKEIEKNNYDTFKKRVFVGNLTKIIIVFKILLKGKYV